ncbi:hypothetical protein LINPERHAP2_LOCUS13792 [Linum perenne]
METHRHFQQTRHFRRRRLRRQRRRKQQGHQVHKADVLIHGRVVGVKRRRAEGLRGGIGGGRDEEVRGPHRVLGTRGVQAAAEGSGGRVRVSAGRRAPDPVRGGCVRGDLESRERENDVVFVGACES